jgi:hypothetical protein
VVGIPRGGIDKLRHCAAFRWASAVALPNAYAASDGAINRSMSREPSRFARLMRRASTANFRSWRICRERRGRTWGLVSMSNAY